MNDEKRDYDKNGMGRREYDIGPCPFFDWEKHKCREVEDVRTEVSTKLSTKIFGIFVASAGAFMIFLAGTLITISYKSLDKITELKTEQAVMSTRQEAIMKHVERGRERHGTKGSLDRSGDDRDKPLEPRHYPTGSIGGTRR